MLSIPLGPLALPAAPLLLLLSALVGLLAGGPLGPARAAPGRHPRGRPNGRQGADPRRALWAGGRPPWPTWACTTRPTGPSLGPSLTCGTAAGTSVRAGPQVWPGSPGRPGATPLGAGRWRWGRRLAAWCGHWARSRWLRWRPATCPTSCSPNGAAANPCACARWRRARPWWSTCGPHGAAPAAAKCPCWPRPRRGTRAWCSSSSTKAKAPRRCAATSTRNA